MIEEQRKRLNIAEKKLEKAIVKYEKNPTSENRAKVARLRRLLILAC
jgi:hypothetical protein